MPKVGKAMRVDFNGQLERKFLSSLAFSYGNVFLEISRFIENCIIAFNFLKFINFHAPSVSR